MLLTGLAMSVGICGEDKPVWLAVTRPMFEEALGPLAEKRRSDGLETVVSTESVEKALADLPRRPAYLLIVGDDQDGLENRLWQVRSPRRKLYRWRIEQRGEFAADALWGDFNGDLVPEIPVGRIPVRTVEQLKLVVSKILRYEQRPPSLNDLRLPIWTGSPGYNALVDSLATGLWLRVVQANAPRWAQLRVIVADANHALCGWPPDQGRLFTRQLKQGGIMGALMGHASARAFYSMAFNDEHVWYTADNVREMWGRGDPCPALVIFSCDAGNFTGPKNCLAESFLLLPGGPAAVIAAATESHPLMNYYAGQILLVRLGKYKRLGNLWLDAQLGAMTTRDFLIERILRDVEGKLEENINIAKLHCDQMLMYALLGDPAMRLPAFESLHGKLARQDDGWHWEVEKPEGAAELHVELRPDGQELPAPESNKDQEAMTELFQRANDTFVFKPLEVISAEKPWKGIVEDTGVLRLVALGPRHIHVAVLTLNAGN